MKAVTDASYVGRFRKLAEGNTDGDAFRRDWLDLIVGTTEASGGRIWNRDAAARWLEADDARVRRASAPAPVASPPSSSLDAVRRKRQTLFVGQDATTCVLHPLEPAGDSIVELTFADAPPQNTQRISQVLAVAHAAAERHALLEERRRLQCRIERLGRERSLCEDLLACEDSASVASVLANDARVIVGADRVGVWLRSGGRIRLAATSGQDSVKERTDLVQAMSVVVAESLCRGKPTASGLIELDAAPCDKLSDDTRANDVATWPAYRLRFAVRTMLVAPLKLNGSGRSESGEVLGAVVAEYLQSDSVADDSQGDLISDDSRQSLLEIARAGSHAVALHTPGAVRRPGLRRVLSRRWCVAAAAVVIGAMLFAIEVPADVSCRGVLQPTERRHVFAPPSGGVVEEIYVAAGRQVTVGQKLLRLRNEKVEADVARLLGEQAATERQIASNKWIRTSDRSLAAARRAELLSEVDALAAKLDSVREQLAICKREQSGLTIYAPTSGTVSTSDLHELLDRRPVAGGQILLTLCRLDGPWRLELRVPESDGGRLAGALGERNELDVTYSSASDPFTDRQARLHAPPLVTRSTPEEGTVLVVEADCNPRQVPYEGVSYEGGEVVARIHAGTDTVGSRLFGGIARVIRHRILFRWL